MEPSTTPANPMADEIIEILTLTHPSSTPRAIRTVLFDHQTQTPFVNARITTPEDLVTLIAESKKLSDPPTLSMGTEQYVSSIWLARLFPKHAMWYVHLSAVIMAMVAQNEETTIQ